MSSIEMTSTETLFGKRLTSCFDDRLLGAVSGWQEHLLRVEIDPPGLRLGRAG